MMEGVLAVAVRSGAESLARRLQVQEPGSLIVTGTARARGFALDGYGVFFDVDVPQMKQSVAWSTMVLMREQMRQRLQQQLADSRDPREREKIQMQLRQLDPRNGSIAAAAQPVEAAVPSVANASAPGTVSAQTVPDIQPIDNRDPNDQYTDAIKTSIIDAMLHYSGPMGLGADEWLTVAARDSDGPMMPGAIDDASTIVLRVKGSDLAAFQSKQITIEEARKRVVVREF